MDEGPWSVTPVFPVLLHWECQEQRGDGSAVDTVGQADCPGESALPGYSGAASRAEKCSWAQCAASSAFLNLPFWEQQRDRAEQAPREQSLISYTLSFNGVNPEVDLCSGRAGIYYTQFLRKGGFGGWESSGQPVWLQERWVCCSDALCPGSGLQCSLGWGQQSQKNQRWSFCNSWDSSWGGRDLHVLFSLYFCFSPRTEGLIEQKYKQTCVTIFLAGAMMQSPSSRQSWGSGRIGEEEGMLSEMLVSRPSRPNSKFSS